MCTDLLTSRPCLLNRSHVAKTFRSVLANLQDPAFLRQLEAAPVAPGKTLAEAEGLVEMVEGLVDFGHLSCYGEAFVGTGDTAKRINRGKQQRELVLCPDVGFSRSDDDYDPCFLQPSRAATRPAGFSSTSFTRTRPRTAWSRMRTCPPTSSR